jgi:hypothetical protein
VIIHRDVFINPIEPEYLAFRFSMGIETNVDLHFKKQDGFPFPEDVVAQLQMKGRSSGLVKYFACPATDVVNGVARARIPNDLAYDKNGWQLRLTGTVEQEPRVIAYGVATATEGVGEQEVPQDVIDTIDLTLVRGVDCVFTVKVWKDVDKTTPYDLSAATIAAPILSSRGGPQIAAFSVTDITGNVVTLSMPAAEVDALPDLCWWNLTVTTSEGLTTLAQGFVSLIVVP